MDPPLRIVSLIASATEIVDALGLGSFQVGRSHECDYPEAIKSLPVCTAPRFAVDGDSLEIDRLVRQTLATAESVYQVFDDVLEQLKPTHILTQTQCRVCAVSLADVERALAARFSTGPMVVALEPDTLADIYSDIRRVARSARIVERGDALVARIESRMSAVQRTAAASKSAPRVAAIEWIEPLMTAGNWTPELIQIAGGVSLFGKAGAYSPSLDWRELVAADPDVIVILPCGFDIPRARAEMHWLTSRAEWNPLRAVRDRRVYIGDGNQYFNRPGPRVADTAEILGEILHPGLFEPRHEGSGWISAA